MATPVLVMVVGFDDSERHSINTLFRLSEHMVPSYTLWTPDAPSPPQVALIDLQSYEAGLGIASPSFNPNLKFIAVGENPPPNAWRTMQRPVVWTELLKEMDALFAPHPEIDFDLDAPEPQHKTVPPGIKVSLIVGMRREERLYLRARLALSGLTDVDEAENARHAIELTSKRHYDLVIISLELKDADPWTLVKTLKSMPQPTRSVILASASPTWKVMEKADHAGCDGLIEIPFNPRQVIALLQMV
jgi:CheY-like chemotaxis protein